MLEQELSSIAIVDFGGQYTHLIARRVRDLGVYSRIVQPDRPDELQETGTVGIILSGGPHSVTERSSHGLAVSLEDLRIPTLGICYGHQLLASLVGGTVRRDGRREYGLATVSCDPTGATFQGLEPTQTVWMNHGDHVESLPPDFKVTASTDDLPVAAFESPDQRLFGMQFHPEVSHTCNGETMLANFLDRCGAERSWDAAGMGEEIIERTRREAGDDRLFLLVSGGVDSLVSLEVCVRAVGPERVVSLHVDTGFMRDGESEEIVEHLEGLGYRSLQVELAEGLFLGRLEGVTEPEEKRRIIGRLFVEVLGKKLGEMLAGEEWKLVQGTIYPDTIESGGTARAAKIKTHHNRVEEIQELIDQGRVIEPLRDLYKDEVRRLGEWLGLPRGLVQRHPFPGPGLAIRMLCSPTDEPDPEFAAEEPQLQELAEAWRLKTRILPVKSVGVQGDFRTYQHPAVVWRPGGGTAGWEELLSCARTVINGMETVNRMVVSLEDLDGVELKLTRTTLTREGADLLRRVDAVIRRRTGHLDEIWQAPVVGLPLSVPGRGQVFVLRPVCSKDAMTADVYPMNPGLWQELADRVSAIDGAGLLLYDVTTKPPGTIEWE